MSSHIPRPLSLPRPLHRLLYLICACLRRVPCSLSRLTLSFPRSSFFFFLLLLLLLLTPIFCFPIPFNLPLILFRYPLSHPSGSVYTISRRTWNGGRWCAVSACHPSSLAAGNLSLRGRRGGLDLVLEGVLTVSNPPLITPKSHRSVRCVKILVGREVSVNELRLKC